MKLKDIVIISGKPGLFKVISQTKDALIVESLDEKKTKFRVQSSYRISVLEEISIYTTDGEDVFLKDIFKKLYEKEALKISVNVKDSKEKLREFFRDLIPNHDDERVYISDIKKLIKWYIILAEREPEIFEDIMKEKQDKNGSTT